MKLLSVAVPCYNSQDYMRHCIDSLLTGGDEVEILIVNDGSKDDTATIANAYAAQYPQRIKALHKPNGGHGSAVNTGIQHATGLYFKVVDSDDWVDADAFAKVLAVLRQMSQAPQPVDLLVANYVYDKVNVRHKKVVRYGNALPQNRIFGWEELRHFRKGQYILMHAIIYRTALLHDCALVLPEHTFYVDNLFAYVPIPRVKSLYYLNVDLYHYFIGREDQSVHENIMIQRIDQQILVNKRMLEQVDLMKISSPKQRDYLLSYLEIVTAVSSILLIRAGTPAHLTKKRELWVYIKGTRPQVYRRLRSGVLGQLVNLRGRMGRGVALSIYKISQRIFGFN